MSSCQACRMLENNQCLAFKKNQEDFNRPISPPPIGGCVRPIVENYLSLIKPNMKVLEIGCGSWSPIFEHCKKVGAQYEAIDFCEEYFGVPVVATRIENLAALSFKDNEFDLVVGNQSMEHWAENGCTNAWGLYQCFRVCKMGGVVALNVPIHFHGTKLFLHGRLNKIKKLFLRHSAVVKFETWGMPSAPILPVVYYPDFFPLRNSPGFHLDIQARKDQATKAPCLQNYFGLNGKLAQIFHYSLSFNLYRLVKKLAPKFF